MIYISNVPESIHIHIVTRSSECPLNHTESNRIRG
ncbi:hypothetical protein F383_19732 [Gossypium arboreum]|uniref:Uncharacterized protein n=1 Tax=Gossypium arboreum TaxID=29729 RepID=A0A0B0NLQ7_GOSAR|nr:hypothetical protein F383_19732 [Gossypium arboreum]